MTALVLSQADIALLSNPTGTRVVIPHLTGASPSRQYAGTTVQFAGDTFPTPFRGEARAKSWNLTARFTAGESATLKALLDLFDTAANSADSRLLLRTHYGQVAGLDEAQAVVVFDVAATPQQGLYTDVSFTATAVQFTLAV